MRLSLSREISELLFFSQWWWRNVLGYENIELSAGVAWYTGSGQAKAGQEFSTSLIAISSGLSLRTICL